jgi:prepilin-type N-terminal cleavage/methylation domain-containing protein
MHSRRRSARGFSLLELLIVIGLIGLMAGIGVPYLIKIGRRQRIMTQAREVQSDLLAARIKAVRRNAGVSVVVTPGGPGGDYHLFRILEPTPPPPTPTVRPQDRNVSTSYFNITPPAGNIITFQGDGRLSVPPNPTPGLIVIEGPPNFTIPNRVTIEVDPGGRVRIITPTTWQ